MLLVDQQKEVDPALLWLGSKIHVQRRQIEAFRHPMGVVGKVDALPASDQFPHRITC